jgi:hypothetical protein
METDILIISSSQNGPNGAAIHAQQLKVHAWLLLSVAVLLSVAAAHQAAGFGCRV